MADSPVVPAVYSRIAAVSAELAKDGIAKTRRNQQQNYAFRGIDEVLNALAPMLTKHGLVILPRILSRVCTERESKSGGTLFSVVVEAAFEFVAASDGSKHEVRTYGEAMDSADKATNKAMSAAYKYAAFLAFCIPTEGDNDADAHTPEPAPRRPVTSPVTPPEPPMGDSYVTPVDGESRVRIQAIRPAKRGNSAKGPWTLWIVALADGREFKTFDDDLAARCQTFKQQAKAIYVAVDGDKLTNIHEAA